MWSLATIFRNSFVNREPKRGRQEFEDGNSESTKALKRLRHGSGCPSDVTSVNLVGSRVRLEIRN